MTRSVVGALPEPHGGQHKDGTTDLGEPERLVSDGPAGGGGDDRAHQTEQRGLADGDSLDAPEPQ